MSNPTGRRAVDAGPLWAGGVATAVVAGLVALVGVLVMEGMLDIAMVRPPLIPVGDSFVVRYTVTAAVMALAATALVIGLSILSLLGAVMKRTARIVPAAGYPPRRAG
jgi:hypothetical protein